VSAKAKRIKTLLLILREGGKWAVMPKTAEKCNSVQHPVTRNWSSGEPRRKGIDFMGIQRK
jgi:hypothetical protein